VPIWMGSLGKIPMTGIAQFVKALEKKQYRMGFLPYKKMGKPSSVVSIIPPADWEKIVEFAKLAARHRARERTPEGPAGNRRRSHALSANCWRVCACKSARE